MATLENLPADQRAVLQLVLQRGRSYGEIARLLSIEPAAVRQRAAAALGALGPQTGLDDTRRAVITDYLLGQLDPVEAEAARGTIGAAPGERAWARVVASELAPLASVGLPEIPSAAPAPPPPAAAAPAPPPPAAAAAVPPPPPPPAPEQPSAAPEPPAEPEQPARRERKQREPLFLGRKRNQGEKQAKPAKAPKPGKAPKAPKEKTPRQPLFLGRKRARGEQAPAAAAAPPPKVPVGDDGTRRSSMLGGVILILLTVVIVAAIVVILLGSGGSSHNNSNVASHSASTTASSSAPAASGTTTTSASSSAKVIAQINLTPPSGKSKTAGIAEVLQEGTSDGIAIVAQNVPANTKKPPDAYAVWLYNSTSDSHLLGFVNPGVGANGRLSTAGGLPANASHYRQLIVTRETKASPKIPGQIILQGALTGL